jgi:hypothetical protein
MLDVASIAKIVRLAFIVLCIYKLSRGLFLLLSSIHKTQSGRTLPWTLRKRALRLPGCPLLKKT